MWDYGRNFVGGRREEPRGGRRCAVRSPFDGSLIGAAPLAARADVDLAVRLARRSLEATRWARAPIETRIEVVERLLALHRAQAGPLLDLVTRENGIPRRSNRRLAQETHRAGLAHIEAARTLAQASRANGAATMPSGPRPSGVVAAFASWHSPQGSALGWLVPALLAGCAVVLAIDPRTALDCQMLGELSLRAKLPEGLLSLLVTAGDSAAYLAGHPLVDHVALSGCDARVDGIAGRAAACSKRLTLGAAGRSPVVILPDADIAATAAGLRAACFFASGQWHAPLDKILVPRHRHAELVERLRTHVETMPVGDPSDPETVIGPLASPRARDALLDAIARARGDGAELVTGGTPFAVPGASGAFLRPTVLANVSATTEIVRAMLFGPIVVAIPYHDIEEAISVANGSGPGASASIWTNDADLGAAVAMRLRAGNVSINGVVPTPLEDGDAPWLDAPWLDATWLDATACPGGRRGIEEFTAIQTVLGEGLPAARSP